MTNEELRRLATAVNVTTSHVGATQEIWDAINVDLQQILDDVSCWEGRHAERMCERLETAIKRLNAAVGNEREGYETAIAVGYENDALRTRLVEVEKDAADMFWNNDDAEKPYGSIDEFLNDEICNGLPVEVGAIYTIQRAVALPKIQIRVTSVDDNECEAEYEVVDAAMGAQA